MLYSACSGTSQVIDERGVSLSEHNTADSLLHMART